MKKLSDSKLIIKLASSSVGKCIFKDLRSEINISSEEKASADGEHGRFLHSKCNLLILIVVKTL